MGHFSETHETPTDPDAKTGAIDTDTDTDADTETGAGAIDTDTETGAGVIDTDTDTDTETGTQKRETPPTAADTNAKFETLRRESRRRKTLDHEGAERADGAKRWITKAPREPTPKQAHAKK